MSKTVHIDLFVSSEEKQAIEARAKRANLATSEWIRRAVIAYESEDDTPEDDMDELRYLINEMAGVAERVCKRLDVTLAKVAENEKLLADRAAMKAAALAEIEASGIKWPFGFCQSDLSESPSR